MHQRKGRAHNAGPSLACFHQGLAITIQYNYLKQPNCHCSQILLLFLDPSLHFLAAQGEIAKIKEEIDKGVFK